MIKNITFETKEYKHGISLWIKAEHNGISNRKLLGSTFKNNEEVKSFILNMSNLPINGSNELKFKVRFKKKLISIINKF